MSNTANLIWFMECLQKMFIMTTKQHIKSNERWSYFWEPHSVIPTWGEIWGKSLNARKYTNKNEKLRGWIVPCFFATILGYFTSIFILNSIVLENVCSYVIKYRIIPIKCPCPNKCPPMFFPIIPQVAPNKHPPLNLRLGLLALVGPPIMPINHWKLDPRHKYLICIYAFRYLWRSIAWFYSK